jgi:cysteine desulfurase
LIGASEKEIVFISGATESNNLALKGAASFYGDKKRHIITTTIDHKCVHDTCRKLEDDGFEVTYLPRLYFGSKLWILPVQKNGLVNLEEFKAAIHEDTLMTSIIFEHNEIGVVQQISEIGKICRERKIFLLTDDA